jgi:phosphate:Na+ symporter
MTEVQTIFQILGGIAFIVYGVHLSGVNLQKLLGAKLEDILRKSAEHPFKGVTIGSVITGLIHSGGTTAMMLIGLMSEGVITLSMAIPVMLGANIGSTIATQLASFRIGVYALIFMVIGVLLHITTNKKNAMKLGEAIIGFSFLFLGMEFIFSGIGGLSANELFIDIVRLIVINPLSAIFIGALATLLLQSSTSISVIVVAMGVAGVIGLSPALFLILGVNLGSSLKVVYLSLRGKNFSGILSVLHLIFNILGVVIFYIFFNQFYSIVELTSSDIGRQIANSYTLYNIINAIILLPFVPLVSYLVQKFFPAYKPFRANELFYLDRKLICTPSVSINRVNDGVVEMANIAHEMLEASGAIIFDDKTEYLQIINQKESRIDYMTERISEYIVQISQQNLPRHDAMKLYSLMHAVADIEHLCDHIVSVSEIFVRTKNDSAVFSEKANKELFGIYGKLRIMQNLTIKALVENNAKLANEIIQHENKVDEIIKKVSSNHLARIEDGTCTAEAGEYFLEALYNLERIGDHYDNVAYAIVDRFRSNERVE